MPQDNTTQLQAILDLAARGNDDAWHQLIDQASQRLFRLTRKMLNSYPQLRRWEDSDDIFQTAAIRLQRSLSSLQPESVRQFFGLAAVEIRRSLIDLLRHHFGPEGAAKNHHSDAAGGTSDNGGALGKQSANTGKPDSFHTWTQFHKSVGELPSELREAFHLVWYGGLGQAEIASLLGVSVPTVKRRMRSARLYLFDALDGESPLSDESS